MVPAERKAALQEAGIMTKTPERSEEEAKEAAVTVVFVEAVEVAWAAGERAQELAEVPVRDVSKDRDKVSGREGVAEAQAGADSTVRTSVRVNDQEALAEAPDEAFSKAGDNVSGNDKVAQNENRINCLINKY